MRTFGRMAAWYRGGPSHSCFWRSYTHVDSVTKAVTVLPDWDSATPPCSARYWYSNRFCRVRIATPGNKGSYGLSWECRAGIVKQVNLLEHIMVA